MRSFSFIVAVSLLAVACGGSSPTAPTTGATLNLRITDTPFGDARAVFVTFSGVSVHRADGEGWETVLFDGAESRTCDLKKLEGPTDVLGVAMLEAGHYTQIRLTTASAVLYLVTDYPDPLPGDACVPGVAPVLEGPPGAPVEISSGQVILNRPFDLANNEATTITLDFDGDRSIRETPPGSGTYRMTPVITVLSVQQPS